MEFIGSGTKLNDNDVEALADRWGVESAIIHAVDEIESNGNGFLPDNRPKILYEAHVFYHLTNGLYGKNNISWPRWDKSLYGAGGGHQYDRLHRAIHLNRAAGLKSASWGRYQVLGNNSVNLGYKSVELFVSEMLKGEKQQLEAFARFCERNDLINSLRTKDWTKFVHRYNGPGQVGYYVKELIEAYEKRKDKNTNQLTKRYVIKFGSKGEDVKELQIKLGLVPDGVFGRYTFQKVKEFQTESGLMPDGVVGEDTWEELDEIKINEVENDN